MTLEIGDRLKKSRTNLGLTGKEVAIQLKLKQSQVSQYENGYVEPNFETLIKLCKLYDVTTDYILLGKDFHLNEFQLNKFQLNKKEDHLLNMFRQLDDFYKGKITGILEQYLNIIE